MPKQFKHLNETWQATATGISNGSGFGDALPAVSRWGVIFQSISRPDRGEYRASISGPDPAGVADAELHQALEEQLVLAAINRSRYVWRPAEAIAKETGLTDERVRYILEFIANDVIAGDQNKDGLWLYTTRDHLSKTAGDVMKQFYKVVETS